MSYLVRLEIKDALLVIRQVFFDSTHELTDTLKALYIRVAEIFKAHYCIINFDFIKA